MDKYIDRMMVALPKEAGIMATENAFDCTYLGKLPLAMAYVPFQRWRGTYEACVGLERGTIFPELDLPFCGRELV